MSIVDEQSVGGDSFWEAAANRRLLIQRCDDCKLYMHPPDLICTRCGSASLTFEAVSGRGVLYSYTSSFLDRSSPDPPTIGVVELEEQSGLLLVADMSSMAREVSLQIGMEVDVVFVPSGPNQSLMPSFVQRRQ